MSIKSFLPCDATYTISEPRPSATLSHGDQRSHVEFTRPEGLGTRLPLTPITTMLSQPAVLKTALFGHSGQ